METNEPPTGGADEPGETPARAAHEPLDGAERKERRALHEAIHTWIPLLIVLVSVLAAIMGWRASVADETATHKDELSRQNLVQQQQLLIEDNDAINSDIQSYGQFAQYSGLAHSLLSDAGRVGGAVGDQLLAEGQADLGIAQYLGKQIKYLDYGFDPSSPNGNPLLNSDGTERPGNAYNAALALSVAENLDTDLHGLAPAQLHAGSVADRTMGVRLTGLAALFVAVIVLLTVAALISGPVKLWLTGTGAVLTVGGLVLFALVELT